VGLVGSIDNDMFGTDMTIGADTALHRITEAIDAIHSTAASHQRLRDRGHGPALRLPRPHGRARHRRELGADPRAPGGPDDWQDAMMCEALGRVARAAGARTWSSSPRAPRTATASRSRATTSRRSSSEELGEDTRVTILGHVQRGGSPSAFDRNLATMLGDAAVEELRDRRPRRGAPRSSGSASTRSSAHR
jgi:6-phosphofructokinase 1